MKNIYMLLALSLLLASCGLEKQDTSDDALEINTVDVEKLTQEVSQAQESIVEEEILEEETTLDTESEVETEENEESDENEETKEVMMEETAHAGVYTDYDSSLLGQTENTVLFFHASWCPSCRASDESISSNPLIEELSILKIDYDNSTDLKKKYGVVTQHTFVQVDANGEMIKKWVGGTSSEDILERLN